MLADAPQNNGMQVAAVYAVVNFCPGTARNNSGEEWSLWEKTGELRERNNWNYIFLSIPYFLIHFSFFRLRVNFHNWL